MPLLRSLDRCAGRVVAIDMALPWSLTGGEAMKDQDQVRQRSVSEVEVETEFAGFDLEVSDDFCEYPGLLGR